jgi:hypothetical protein
MCSNVGADDGVAVGVANWILELPDGTRLAPAERKVPGVPGQVLAVGGVYMLSQDECAVGWIVFAVPAGVTPDAAIFTGADGRERFALP